MPRKTRDNPFDILSTRWHFNAYESKFGEDVMNTWEHPIRDYYYPMMDGWYSVADSPNPTLSQLQNTLTSIKQNPPPRYPNIYLYDDNCSKKHYRGYLSAPQIFNYIRRLNDEYITLRYDIAKRIGIIEHREEIAREDRIRREREALEEMRIAEDKRFHLTNFNTLSAQISELQKKFSQLDFDVKQDKREKERDFTLFKSELTSQIPAQGVNVSKLEHDEDVAQLNDTIAQLQKQVDLSTVSQGVNIEKQNKTFKENNRQTEDRIKKLNKTFAEHRNLIAGQEEDLQDVKGGLRDTNLELHNTNLKIRETNERVDVHDRSIQETNERIDYQGQELRFKGKEIELLREALNALEGKTKTFINNEKRQKQTSTPKVAKKESVVARAVRKAAFPDLTKRPWLKQSVTGRFFQLVNQW